MTALALRSELPEVNVVLAVARRAIRRQFHLAGLTMAVAAGELRVAASQRETCLLIVIEIPQPPAVRRVALRAIRSETAFVHVRAAMARHAFMRRADEGARCVTLAATHDDVHA